MKIFLADKFSTKFGGSQTNEKKNCLGQSACVNSGLAPSHFASSNYSLCAAATWAQHVAKVTELTHNFHLAIIHCDHSGWWTVYWFGIPKTSRTDVVRVSDQTAANATTPLVNPVGTAWAVKGVRPHTHAIYRARVLARVF